MATASEKPATLPILRWVILGALCLIILTLGVKGLKFLKSLGKGPEKRSHSKLAVEVEVHNAKTASVCRPVIAFGTVRPARLVQITPELAGLVVSTHPQLKEGRIIDKGEVLFQLETRRLELSKANVLANMNLLKANINRLEQERANASALKKHSESLVKVMEDEVRRLESLRKRNVGTVSALDAARRQALQLRTSVINADGALALIEPRRKELAARLDQAKVQLQNVALDIEKATIRSPFRGKVERNTVEVGRFVQPGVAALTLIDQSELEVVVPLTPLQYQHLNPQALALANSGKQSADKLLTCQVHWAQGTGKQTWRGQLSRLESVESQSRTFRVIVSIKNPRKDFNPLKDIPLNVGLFVEVELPGRSYEQVLVIPREWIEDGRVKVAKKQRLDFVEVDIVRYLDDGVMVRGVPDGSALVSTRLPYPTRGMSLKAMPAQDQNNAPNH